jgi:glucose-6-phosphate 1-dehydrogenase
MDFCYQRAFGIEPPAAYETLLLDVISGDATLFTRGDEVEAQWRLISPIEEAWANQRIPELTQYAAGTDGPAMANEMLERNGHRWRHLLEKLGSCD